MSQCAKIIVGFMANVGNVFIKRLQTFFLIFFHVFNVILFLSERLLHLSIRHCRRSRSGLGFSIPGSTSRSNRGMFHSYYDFCRQQKIARSSRLAEGFHALSVCIVFHVNIAACYIFLFVAVMASTQRQSQMRVC